MPQLDIKHDIIYEDLINRIFNNHLNIICCWYTRI